MELLNQIFDIIFYILFFSWTFLKIRNVVLIKKMNYKEIYKNIKKDLICQKFSKGLFKIIIISIILFAIYLAIYLAIGLLAGALALFMIFITLGGVAYVDTGSDSTFYDNLMSFVGNHFSLFKYIIYYIYLIVYTVLIRAIHINILSYKKLQNDVILNNVQPNVSKQSNTINLETNTLTKKNSLILLSLFVILVVICICMLTSVPIKISNNKAIDLENVVFPSMNIAITMTPNWYFFNNDKLYVYDNHGDEIYSTNILAKNKEILTASENLRYANIFMVYGDEMFYYTEYNRGIKKINLKTGEIKNVVDDKYLYLIPDTLNDGKVLVNYENNYAGKAHTFFAILDLKTGLLSNEKKINYATEQPYFYDLETEKIYYIDSSDETNHIYEDNKIIYTYEADNNLSGWKSNPNSNVSDLVFVQDNYIFAIIANKVIKIDKSNYTIIEEKEIDKSFSLISSVRGGGARTLGVEEGPAMTSTYPLFAIIDKYSSYDSVDKCGDIYQFDSETLSFEKIIEKNARGGFLQKYENYFILQTDNETVVYNDVNKKYKIYNSTNYSLEKGYIYLMTYTGDFYHQKENNLNFKIQKLLLKDIVK